MKKFILYIILALGITQLNLSCAPESKIPFLTKMDIYADSLIDAPFPDSLDFRNRGIELSKAQYYALTSDSVEGEKIVAIKKYKENFLVFFCRTRVISTILFDKDGKLLDVCPFFGLTPRYNEVLIDARNSYYLGMDTIGYSPLWNVRFQDNNHIVLKGVFHKTDTIKMLYKISDRITKIRRISSKKITTPALDILTFAVSQVDSVCERFSVYFPVWNGDQEWNQHGLHGSMRLYPYIKYNPQGVLQWIYDHKNERIEKCLYYCHESYHRYCWGFSLDFLRENILKLKDKKAQEYLLNMKVFKAESSME